MWCDVLVLLSVPLDLCASDFGVSCCCVRLLTSWCIFRTKQTKKHLYKVHIYILNTNQHYNHFHGMANSNSSQIYAFLLIYMLLCVSSLATICVFVCRTIPNQYCLQWDFFLKTKSTKLSCGSSIKYICIIKLHQNPPIRTLHFIDVRRCYCGVMPINANYYEIVWE